MVETVSVEDVASVPGLLALKISRFGWGRGEGVREFRYIYTAISTNVVGF